jgi:thioredoxin-like negative regulator of GroEL
MSTRILSELHTHFLHLHAHAKDALDCAHLFISHFSLVHLFEVSAVPSILAFRNGVVVDKFIGLVDANKIEELIEKLLRKKRI